MRWSWPWGLSSSRYDSLKSDAAEGLMGAWGDGPFDNDDAADWCVHLHDSAPSERGGVVRAALTTVADHTGYLDYTDAAPAIAAAAIVASRIPGGTPITSAYAPDFLLADEPIELDADLQGLAMQALDRVLGDDSEWRELWGDSGATEFPEIDKLRAVLSGPPEIPGQLTLL